MEYPEEEYLMISGIQHFAFCRRQWALIPIEQVWQENVRTAEGRILHEKCHDACQKEKRGRLLISRGLRVFSRTMGVSGVCDVVEFHEAEEGAVLQKHPGFWVPYPIEYKHGDGKSLDADRLQLCAQAMCLEEMYCTGVSKGALFYATPHRREEVVFDTDLRDRVRQIFAEMHQDMARGHTPRVKPSKSCQACSLKPICLPHLMKHHDVSAYYADVLGRET